MSWNTGGVEHDYPSSFHGQYPHPQYQSGYTGHSPNHSTAYLPNPSQIPYVDGQHQQQPQYSPNHSANPAFPANSFTNPLPTSATQSRYDFDSTTHTNGYETSPNNGLFSLENPGQPSQIPPTQPSYYPQSGTKRGRPDYRIEDAYDEEPDTGRNEHKDNQKAKPGACARCKNLKVRCEFKTDTDPCKRCLNGGHDCVIPGRKKRRTPPKREHLLAEIQKQHETIEKLMAQLEAEQIKKRSSLSDEVSGSSSPPILSPSSGSYFDEEPTSTEPMTAEKNKVVEDWIIKARESLAEFGGLIGLGGSMPKKYIVKEDPEDSPSSGEDDADDDEAEDQTSDRVGIAIVDPDGEQSPKIRTDIRRRTSSRSRRGSHSSGGDSAHPHRKHSADTELATLPSEAAPYGLMAKLSLKTGRGVSVEAEDFAIAAAGEEDGSGVANADFFRGSPAPDPIRTGMSVPPQAPAILAKGLITPTEAEELFKLFFDTMNLSVSLVDPVLYTAQRTVHRSPFLFTVICAIASKFYTKKPNLYQQAIAYAQVAAGSSLVGGQKNVEMCMAYLLMSMYPAPFKRWEDSRTYLYLGLAIRIATELNLHLPPTATPQNEVHAREQLNRTRVWINCFNLDRSTSSQYGKRPIISSIDHVANHSDTWWNSSPYNLKDFDIQLCCYNAELKVMGNFIEKIYSDPGHPTGLNKNLNFEEIAIATDEELQRLQQKWWPILDANVDPENPQGVFRVGLLKMAYGYSRLIALSYGFQHAFGKNTGNQNEKPFLMRCIAAATDILNSLVEFNNRPERWIYVRHGPEAQSVFVTFAGAFLIKILQPKFASHLEDSLRADILGRVKRVIEYLSSPQIGADGKYGPKTYAKFLKNLSGPEILRRRSAKSPLSGSIDGSNGSKQSLGVPVDHPSPASTNYSLSPPPTNAPMAFDPYAPPPGNGSTNTTDFYDPSSSFAGTTGYDTTGLGLTTDYFPNPMMGPGFTDEDMMQSMSINLQQSDMNQQWPTEIPWLSQYNFQNDEQMNMYGQQYNAVQS